MNKKIYPIGFFLLLIINISLVIFITLKPKPSHRFNKRDLREKVTDLLEFSPEQKNAFFEMVKKHRDSVRAIDRQERALTKQYFSYLKDPDQTGSKEELLEEIALLKQQKIQATYHHFESVKAICSQQQLARFDSVMSTIIPVITSTSRSPFQRRNPTHKP